MNRMSKLILASVLPALILGGCSSTPKKKPSPAAPGTESQVPAPTSDVTSEGTGAGVQGVDIQGQGLQQGNDPLNDPNSLLSKRIVYFDYDSNVVREEFTPVLEAHANYLTSNPDVKVVLEGHTDEQGTREYNLGLGERRAKAVQQYLMLLGASGGQIEIVSYGEERPAAVGVDEETFALNRRVELVYPGK